MVVTDPVSRKEVRRGLAQKAINPLGRAATRCGSFPAAKDIFSLYDTLLAALSNDRHSAQSFPPLGGVLGIHSYYGLHIIEARHHLYRPGNGQMAALARHLHSGFRWQAHIPGVGSPFSACGRFLIALSTSEHATMRLFLGLLYRLRDERRRDCTVVGRRVGPRRCNTGAPRTFSRGHECGAQDRDPVI